MSDKVPSFTRQIENLPGISGSPISDMYIQNKQTKKNNNKKPKQNQKQKTNKQTKTRTKCKLLLS
jgi:Na+/glutamate symporter